MHLLGEHDDHFRTHLDEFGQFVSNIAALPRIVTLHNFDITQQGSELRLQLQAKTYRTAVSEQGQ